MRAPRHLRRALCLAIAAGTSFIPAAVATAQAPLPCNGVPQITDAQGDGHHPGTDVLSAWLTESGGGLQAVIQVRSGIWQPEHTDATVNGSGYALVFDVGGGPVYVRASADPAGVVTYDYGPFAGPSTFDATGAPTTGSVTYGFPGTATIDIPSAALGIAPGTVIGAPYVLTYDGIVSGVPTPVDHAPGDQLPNDPARGADYVVGSCVAAGAAGPGAAGGGATSGPGAGAVTAVLLQSAPKRLAGGGTAKITGRIVPAAAGVNVRLARRGGATAFSNTRTAADGSFSFRVPVREITQLRATAGKLGSNTLTIDVTTRVRVRVKRLRGGAVRVDGTYAPALPGKALLLGRFSATPKATKTINGGRFSFRYSRSRAPRGALQVVVVPARNRAGRATSNTITLSRGN